LVLFAIVVGGELVNGCWVSNETDPRWERKASTCGLSVTGDVVDDGERWRIWREFSVVVKFGERCCRIGFGDEVETSIPSVLDDKRLLHLLSFGHGVDSFVDEPIEKKSFRWREFFVNLPSEFREIEFLDSSDFVRRRSGCRTCNDVDKNFLFVSLI